LKGKQPLKDFVTLVAGILFLRNHENPPIKAKK
jgi:hypothetical protein